MFLLAAERLGVPPARCAVIEDAPQGVEAANRAGMTSIGLTGTTTREKLAHARLVVDHLSELSPERIASLIADAIRRSALRRRHAPGRCRTWPSVRRAFDSLSGLKSTVHALALLARRGCRGRCRRARCLARP